MGDNSLAGGGAVGRVHSVWRVGLFLVTILLAVTLSIHKVEDRDFGWLLRTGQYIYETHTLPRVDFYSFTVPGNKYIDSHWLFQLLLYAFYKILGIAGPTLLAAMLVACTFSSVYFIAHDRRRYLVTALAVMAGVVIAGERYVPRPHLITLLFLAVYFLILEKYRKRGGRLILLLPVFQLLWVNMHGVFALGLALPALYLALAFVEEKMKLNRLRPEEEVPDRKWYATLAVILVVMVCESFLTPYTVDIALYPITLFKELHGKVNIVAASVSELTPPLAGSDLSRSEIWFKWMFVVSIVCFILNLKRLNVTHLCVFGAFLYLALNARRNMDVFAVVAAPIAVANVNGFLDEVSRRIKRIGVSRAASVAQLILAPVVIMGAVWLIVQIATNRYYMDDRSLRRFGFGVSQSAYPVKAANFVEAVNLSGNMFNDPADGGYLIWRFHPDRKVYYDGRWEVYGDRFLENFQRVTSSPVLFDEHTNALGIGYAILHHTAGRMPEFLIKHLIDSPLWTPVHFDEIAVVFARNMPENARVIQEFGFDFVDFEQEGERYAAKLPTDITDSHFAGSDGFLVRLTELIPQASYPFVELSKASFYRAFGYYEAARLLYERAVQKCPDCSMAHAGLGAVYWKMKLYPNALSEFEAATRLDPCSVTNLMNLGYMHLVAGRIDEAQKCFERVSKLDGRNADARLQLGKIYAQKGMNDKAAKELRRALKLRPELAEARGLLERIEAQ